MSSPSNQLKASPLAVNCQTPQVLPITPPNRLLNQPRHSSLADPNFCLPFVSLEYKHPFILLWPQCATSPTQSTSPLSSQTPSFLLLPAGCNRRRPPPDQGACKLRIESARPLDSKGHSGLHRLPVPVARRRHECRCGTHGGGEQMAAGSRRGSSTRGQARRKDAQGARGAG